MLTLPRLGGMGDSSIAGPAAMPQVDWRLRVCGSHGYVYAFVAVPGDDAF